MERRTGFSLPELLIVLGIIAILIAILLPVLSKLRKHGERAQCASNLHQIGNAFANYASQNRGFVPRADGSFFVLAGSPTGRVPMWIPAIARQLGMRADWQWSDIRLVKTLACPSLKDDDVPSGYVVNAFAFETAPDWRAAPPVQVAKLRSAARLPWLLDSADRYGMGHHGPDDLVYFEQYHVVYRPDHLGTRWNVERHAGSSSNVLWGDWHVTMERAGALRLEHFDDGLRRR